MQRVVLCVLLAGACAPEPQQWENTYKGDGEDAFLVDDDFPCLGDGTFEPVAGRRFMNTNGHRADMLGIARGKLQGVEYPVGTVVQLIAGEALVKRGKGYNEETGDWEYVQLDVASGRTIITGRGGADVRNVAGTCNGCHATANNFDYVCFTYGACPGLALPHADPVGDDPRCSAR